MRVKYCCVIYRLAVAVHRFACRLTRRDWRNYLPADTVRDIETRGWG